MNWLSPLLLFFVGVAVESKDINNVARFFLLPSCSTDLDGEHELVFDRSSTRGSVQVSNALVIRGWIKQDQGNSGWIASMTDTAGKPYYGLMSDGQKNELIFEWTSWSDDDDDTEGNRSQFIMELGEEFSIADHKWHHFIFSTVEGKVNFWLDGVLGIDAHIKHASRKYRLWDPKDDPKLVIGNSMFSNAPFKGSIGMLEVSSEPEQDPQLHYELSHKLLMVTSRYPLKETVKEQMCMKYVTMTRGYFAQASKITIPTLKVHSINVAGRVAFTPVDTKLAPQKLEIEDQQEGQDEAEVEPENSAFAEDNELPQKQEIEDKQEEKDKDVEPQNKAFAVNNALPLDPVTAKESQPGLQETMKTAKPHPATRIVFFVTLGIVGVALVIVFVQRKRRRGGYQPF